MRRVFVSGASGVVGYGILRALRKSSRELLLVGSSIFDDSVAPGFCDIFEQAVPTSESSYLGWLKETLDKHQIQIMFPGIEPDLYHWSDNADFIETDQCHIAMNRRGLIDLCRDKWLFYLAIQELNIKSTIPSSLDPSFDFLQEQFGLPFLLKPRRSYGSKGIVRVHNRETFMRHQSQIGCDLMAQPLIGSDNEEYSCAVFGDGAHGFSAHVTLRRTLSPLGFTEKAEVVDGGDVMQSLSELCFHFNPVGPTNFQFRVHKGELKLLEINPRISSSTSIRAAFGYNEPAMALDFFLNGTLPTQPEIKRGRAVRYWEDYVFNLNTELGKNNQA
jgi:carbamoyl-phosphate synthase large subunit